MAVPAEQLPTGTIVVKQIKAPAHAVGLYAPSFFVGAQEKIGKHNEAASWSTLNHRVTIVEAVSEVGSGLNGCRPKLLQAMEP